MSVNNIQNLTKVQIERIYFSLTGGSQLAIYRRGLWIKNIIALISARLDCIIVKLCSIGSWV